jgi:hypothetical protein
VSVEAWLSVDGGYRHDVNRSGAQGEGKRGEGEWGEVLCCAVVCAPLAVVRRVQEGIGPVSTMWGDRECA